MITCAECKKRLYPEDPSIRLGRYHMSTCEHYCNKPQYYRDMELPKLEPEIPNPIEVRQLKYQVEQAKAGYLHLQKKLDEHLTKKRKSLDVI